MNLDLIIISGIIFLALLVILSATKEKIVEENHLEALEEYIENFHTDLHIRIAGKPLSEAIQVVCDHFQIEPPMEGDLIQPHAKRILEAIISKDREARYLGV